ncbi:MAG: PhoU domain-containing protein [Gemmatimonadota bacterium]|nr:PhoU domain-containing protein [Gemmatimonadota bacterium]
MLRELIAIFRSERPLEEMGENFERMLQLTHEMMREAGSLYFAPEAPPDSRTHIYKRDIEVNKLERTIRKQVIAHLSVRGSTPSLPYCLLLISLVKDVERLGDYAKNLSEVREYHPGPLPDDETVHELQSIREGVERAFAVAAEVFAASDHERAVALIREGRTLTHRCDLLVARVAGSDYGARDATAIVMATRFYKRLAAHVLNVLSSVVMPLHKLDYYDEDEIPEGSVGEDD